jgi:siroheme synthase
VKHPGTVFIVGAGPGNPDLITIRGLTCLREADVVLHDRLVDKRLLEDVRPNAEVIDVGKEPGHEDIQQERIECLLIEKAREGKSVCRLKGGDPFVFGRGGEEARALVEAGIPFEIVPGV